MKYACGGIIEKGDLPLVGEYINETRMPECLVPLDKRVHKGKDTTIVINTLSSNEIKIAKEAISKLCVEMQNNRKNLIEDEKKVMKYKDENYYKFLEYLELDE